jgi:hypothetical protein
MDRANVYLAITVAVAGLTIFTLLRIRSSSLTKHEKDRWSLLVFALPGIGTLAWYAYEIGRSRRAKRSAEPQIATFRRPHSTTGA